MPYVVSEGVRTYYELAGDGPPVVLLHGRTISLEVWKVMGYVEGLAGRYRLVMVDVRGHGKSDKPHASGKYAMKLMVGDAVAVLDDLGIDKATFWGYSMGGRIALATGKYAPERLSSLVIGGAGLGETDSREDVERAQKSIQQYRERVELVEKYKAEGWPDDIEDWKRRFWESADYEAIIACTSHFENLDMAEYLPKVATPCLFYVGSEDNVSYPRAKACAEIMQNAQFVSIRGLDHAEGHYRSSAVLPYVLRFLESVTRT